QLRAMDLQYGPGFRALQSLSHGEGRAYGDVALPSGVARGPWRIHPVLLDACFQLLPAAYGEAEGVPQVVLSGVDHICAHRPIGARAQSVVQCSGSLDEERGLTANITVLSEEGRVALEFLGVRLHAVQPRRASASLPREGLCWLQTEVQPAPLQGPAGEGASGVRRWLAVDAVGCWSRDLVVAFEAVGDECVTLTEDDSATLASRLRKVLRGADGEAWDGVLLLAPTTPISESSTTKEVLRAQEDRYVATLEVLHSLAGCSETGAPRVYLVAQTDLQADRSLSIGLEHAALWGLGRCVPYELPQLRCTRLAVGLHGREAARRIVDEVRCGLREEEVYLEATGRSVARVLSVPVKGLRGAHKGRPRETWVRPESAFVVTGGLGGLGMATARWLVERGARTLVLLGRSLPTEAQEERLDELRATGVTVRFVQVDVSMSDQVEAVFADLQYSAPPIRGIIHAAGVAADGLMVDQTVEHWNAAAAPKVAGAWNLHRATQGLALDVFVMYSSVAGVMGGPGVAGYAAANVGLDALAHYRRDLGLPALSVNWGWFAGVGLGADADLQRLLMARGVDTLGVDEGGAILDILLSRGVTQAAALRWEPRRWLEFFPERQSSTMLAPLLEQVTAEARCAIDVQGEVLRGLDPRVRVKEIERLVCACTADVLRTDPAGLSADQPFRAMGIDSLMGLAVRNRIENALGITLSATLIWTYPTIAELAAHLCECLGDEQGADLESMASDDLVRMGEQWLSK
ncbi:MAG: type I polyketide synthase, partial [Myxococcales bacterium]|nr:type I polyketide synthase [Myxococcales bacterium]